MNELIGFRALQGIGAGGNTVRAAGGHRRRERPGGEGGTA